MNRSNALVPLLAVIAVILGLNYVKGSPWATAQQIQVGPVQPTVAAGQVTQLTSSLARAYRFWTDGTVDVSNVFIELNCGEALLCGPVTLLTATCNADVNHNGEVATEDLLDLLAAWGPCE